MGTEPIRLFGRDEVLERALKAHRPLEHCSDPARADLIWAIPTVDLGWRTFGIDRCDLLDLGLPLPPTRVGRAGEVVEHPMFARSLRVGGPSGPVQGRLETDCLLQPVLASARAEGEVTLLFVEGVLTQATRTIPMRHGPPVCQQLGLFQGEDRVGRQALAEVRRRFDAELERRPPLFLRVDLLRRESEVVVSDLRLCGPAWLMPSTAGALATALLGKGPGDRACAL